MDFIWTSCYCCDGLPASWCGKGMCFSEVKNFNYISSRHAWESILFRRFWVAYTVEFMHKLLLLCIYDNASCDLPMLIERVMGNLKPKRLEFPTLYSLQSMEILFLQYLPSLLLSFLHPVFPFCLRLSLRICRVSFTWCVLQLFEWLFFCRSISRSCRESSMRVNELVSQSRR